MTQTGMQLPSLSSKLFLSLCMKAVFVHQNAISNRLIKGYSSLLSLLLKTCDEWFLVDDLQTLQSPLNLVWKQCLTLLDCRLFATVSLFVGLYCVLQDRF